jgi:hypothetical protein
MEDEFLFADGFDNAVMGVARRAGQPDVMAYDYAKCVQILMERDDMTEEEAFEYMEFNVVGSFVGEKTPIFITPYTPLSIAGSRFRAANSFLMS